MNIYFFTTPYSSSYLIALLAMFYERNTKKMLNTHTSHKK
jgi:hypothetical protein